MQDISINAPTHHHFTINDQIKDESILEKLKEMYHSDFNKTCSALPCENQTFLNMMKREVKLINNHYHSSMKNRWYLINEVLL